MSGPDVSRIERSDAARNRMRITRAARDLFVEQGVTVSARAVARRAAVGVATLYRHFPARADLVRAVLADEVEACESELADAMEEPDAWRGIERFVRVFAHQQLRNRSLNDLLLGPGGADSPFAEARRRHARGLDELVGRARREEKVRPDLRADEVRACLHAIAGLRSLGPERAPEVTETVTTLLLVGLRLGGRPVASRP